MSNEGNKTMSCTIGSLNMSQETIFWDAYSVDFEHKTSCDNISALIQLLNIQNMQNMRYLQTSFNAVLSKTA